MLKIFLIAFVESVVFTWIAIRVALKLGILDQPAERKIHAKPMPLLGGVAVFFAFSLALLFNFHFSLGLKGIVLGSLILMAAGVVDDVRGLSAKFRLLLQVLCASIVIAHGVCLRTFPMDWPAGNVLNIALTVLWIVGVTNAVNFMDGADGLAAGMAGIASLAFFFIAYQTGQKYFAFLNIALAGACLGFLIFNFNPAKIFLGDAGSSFLGFSLASLAVMGEWAENNPIVALSIPVIILAVPIFDIAYISVSRIARGDVRSFKEWIEYVGKDHLHHRLAAMGFSHREVVTFIYLICAVFAVGALTLKDATTQQSLFLVLQACIILTVVTVLMVVGNENMAKRRLYEKRIKEMENKT
jgi:UDP-GlcNAc:undecaprenyl-phosphate GlcNAc-1-phosphate transferase